MNPLRTAGLIFLLISLAHLSRMIFKFSAVIGGYEVPIFINAITFIVFLGLSIWMFRAVK